ncbi:ubiquinone biosynthesis protein-like protein coq-8 [Macroventuria anomochaeta]|uniref:Ubiquinone biosynthesis protein-like protein coq-8 n=1 Tax=Macroventuria anomochaeta TaxID=301207 RepID=A0ACB6S9X2_9PLEO|nr:ubiquinone biosynthesis protein-like protein coq-8 [Macroventuria anomochaeta]KAF2630385.1 ubiquinone biosynthesis protein-like protein coq-8 [Macroventuria anomochaeta]
MAGRRFVDAAKLFQASKSIASKHITLRSQQFEAYQKTSTLAKAVKSQTDRVTLTASAAIALYQRSNEAAPAYSKAAPERPPATDAQHADIPRKETVERQVPEHAVREGLKQDHHYDRSGQTTAAQPPPEQELDIEQAKAPRRSLPDGTIPPIGATLGQEEKGQDTFSERPVSEAPKDPLANEQATQVRQEGEGITPAESTDSTIPLPGQPRGTSLDASEPIPAHANDLQPSTQTSKIQSLLQGHDRDVFYTRSVESQPASSAQPRSQIPKETTSKQGNNSHVEDGRLNQDVFYATPKPGQQQVQGEEPVQAAVPADEEIPEGINTDVFHSKRVARMLGQDRYSRKEHLGPTVSKGTGRHPLDDRPIVQTDHSAKLQPNQPAQPPTPVQATQTAQPATTEQEMQDLSSKLAKDVEAQAAAANEMPTELGAEPEKPAYALRESRVPSSRFGRLWQYAGLGTSMALGAVGESLRRVTGTAAATGGSLMLSPGNLEILVAKLSRMRGAALKLGQMISFQDSKMLPPQIQEVLQRVQDSADYMPAWQRDKVLASNLGSEWRDLFESFEDIPIAAASIGQVHKAVLKSTGQPVAVKVQYPGVANSIDSDLNNLSILLTASRILPRGLFLDKTIANARTELGWECNYTREAECQTRFRNLIADDTSVFTVPKVFPEASGPTVLTAELMSGVGVAKLKNLTQSQRDWIGTQILRLCLREIVEFKFMQTDPNWTNFLFNAHDNKIELLDFGASREYPDEFVGPYINVLIAASKEDRIAIRDLSLELGYLTGDESTAMLNAHTDSVLTLAEPFKSSGPKIYDFRDQTITDRVRDLIPVMVRERLAPPPEETYSLHRKLSGAFLLCARLGSRVPCRELFEKAIATYHEKAKMK